MPNPLKYPLLSQLYKSLQVLKNRREMIPKYVKQSDHWTGKNHYSLDMLPDLDRNIAEMKAAIRGIEDWKKEKQKEAREERKAMREDLPTGQAGTHGGGKEVVSDSQ